MKTKEIQFEIDNDALLDEYINMTLIEPTYNFLTQKECQQVFDIKNTQLTLKK